MPSVEIFRSIDHSANTDELLNILSDFYCSHGFQAVCYVLPKKSDADDYQLFERGMPRPWMDRYTALNYREIDPLPPYVLTQGKVMTIREVLAELDPTENEAAYLAEFAKSPVTDGLLMPTFGKKRAQGFFGATQVSDEDLASCDRSLMHAVAQHAHWRFDQFGVDREAPSNLLSPRELEILQWIGAGKSNPEIALILGISPPTVATHLRRLFSKLEVNDRVSAALKGYKLGLLSDA